MEYDSIHTLGKVDLVIHELIETSLSKTPEICMQMADLFHGSQLTKHSSNCNVFLQGKYFAQTFHVCDNIKCLSKMVLQSVPSSIIAAWIKSDTIRDRIKTSIHNKLLHNY